MTVPLGFRRSTRKKLRRCAHVNATSFRDFASDTVIVRCHDCGASKNMTIPLGYRLSNFSDAYVTERLIANLPERIAR